MGQTIAANQYVAVNPGVVGAGGLGVILQGLVLTTSTRVPIGQVYSFPNAASVAAFFGATSVEALGAAQYFLANNNSTIKPGSILFAQYPWAAPVAAYLQSGQVSGLTLAQLQAISGTLIVTIDGQTFTSSSFNLASATSFSSAASIIQTALGAVDASVTGAIAPAVGVTAGTSTITNNVLTVVTMSSGAIVPGAVLTGTGVTTGTTIVAQLTGTAGGAGTYQVSVAQTVAATAITATNASAGVLTVSAVSSGTVAVGQTISGSGVTTGTMITGLLTGAGGTGTYVVGTSQTASSTTITCGASVITYDSVSGCFIITGGIAGAAGSIGFATGTAATALSFTAAAGAVLSQGSNIATPTAFMTALEVQVQNWFSLVTTFDPVVADKVALAQWVNAQGVNYCYIEVGHDIALTTNSYASTAWGQIQALNLNGTLPIYDPNLLTDGNILGFAVAGFFAALNFNAVNGRQTLAFQTFPGIAASVNSTTIAAQLKANGINYYGVVGEGSSTFTWMYPGAMSGKFLWADTYAQAVWIESQLTISGLTLLSSVGNIPYNAPGAALLDAMALGPIQQAVNFGAIRAGVTLSPLQIAEVNNAAGFPIDQTLFQRGWYFLVGVAAAPIRAARQSPPMTLWYTDGQSIQQITIASLVIQ